MTFNMASLDLYHLTQELRVLAGAKVDKIYHPKKRELLIQFYSSSVGKKILRIEVPSFMYLTEVKDEQPQSPSGFCIFLRKRLDNARMKEINQFGFERIVELVFDAKDEQYRLIFELFSKGNMILCKEDLTIISPLENQRWSQREVKPRVKYVYPTKDLNFLELDEDKLQTLVAEKKREIVKLLAVELGLGGVYAEELLQRAGVNKDKKELNAAEIKRIVDAAEKIVKTKKPGVYSNANEILAISPIELDMANGVECKGFGSLDEALDHVLTKRVVQAKKAETLSKHQNKIEKVSRIIEKQEEHLSKLEAEIAESNLKAEIIYNNYKLVDGILKELQKASKKLDWGEIKAKLKGHKIVKEVNAKEKSVVLELD